MMEAALVYALVGALAASVTWLAVRTPWDSLGACVILLLPVLAGAVALSSVTAHTAYQWWDVGAVASTVMGLFAGSAVVAWLLQRRMGCLLAAAPPVRE